MVSKRTNPYFDHIVQETAYLHKNDGDCPTCGQPVKKWKANQLSTGQIVHAHCEPPVIPITAMTPCTARLDEILSPAEAKKIKQIPLSA